VCRVCSAPPRKYRSSHPVPMVLSLCTIPTKRANPHEH
jgi:hypothetical protein